ncbi:MAG: YbaY family lipoprotein [Halioglobus sp.]
MPVTLLVRARIAVRSLIVLVVFMGVAACTEESTQSKEVSMTSIDGAVSYRERIALPPGAVVEVELQDISRADAPATVMALVTMTPEHAPPYPFSISYDPADIDSRMRYGLRASILVNDKLMFTTTEYIDPFAGNPLQVVVQRVPGPAAVSGPTLVSTHWALQTLNGDTAPMGANDKPLDIQFQGDEMRAGGFSGCNRYSGAFNYQGTATHGSPLGFGMMAGTMMACAEVGDLERAYLGVLESVTSYRLESGTLSLLAGSEVVATFRAI